LEGERKAPLEGRFCEARSVVHPAVVRTVFEEEGRAYQ
jgi:hypothetical protein